MMWRRPAPAGRVIFVMGICLAVWTLLDATNIQRAAQASPPGVRRTVSLDVIGPIATISRYSGFAAVNRAFDGMLGRRPGLLPKTANAVHEVLRPSAQPRTIDNGLVSLARYGQWPHSVGSAVAGIGTSSARNDQVSAPSASNPLRILIIGDSVGENLGQALSNRLYASGVVSVDLDTHSATGLARPDYFNWPAEIRNDVATFHPQETVSMFGGNDGQGFVESGQVYQFGDPGWVRIYSQRVEDIMASLTSEGGTVFWVGMPPMEDSTLNAEMQVLNSIYSTVVSRHAHSHFLVSTGVLGGPGGTYAAYLPDASGQSQQVRNDDGVHLSMAGSSLLAGWVEAQMSKVLGVTFPGS